MQRTVYPVLNGGPARIGRAEASWWAGFEQIVEVEAESAPPAEEVTYSSSITRPACACKILGGRLGQGCSIPTEGFPGTSVAKPNGNGEGPSTVAVVGGLAGAGLVLALATGLL